MVGQFILETLETLPSFDASRDPGRMVYITFDQKIYYGQENQWSEVGSGSGGFGEVNTSFTNGDVLYPGYMYYIDTSTSPLSGYISEVDEYGNSVEDGDIITVLDISGSFNTNTFTIEASGGTNIIDNGSVYKCDTRNSVYMFFYDSTYKWRIDQGGEITPSLVLKPENFVLDDTNVGSDGGSLFGIVETVDFDSSEDGSIWGIFELPSEWNESKDILFEVGYSLNGDEHGTDVDLQLDYYLLESGDSFSEATSGAKTDTITSSISGADQNTGNWISEELNTIKIDNADITDETEYISFKFTRLGSTDTYNGTFQLSRIKLYQD